MGIGALQPRHLVFLCFVFLVMLGVVLTLVMLVVRRPSSANSANLQPSGPMKKCPYCAEMIRAEAIVCRYCGRDLPTTPTTPTF